MKYWMYIGEIIGKEELKELKAAGITGVMGGKSLAEAAQALGLEVLLCGGAFPKGDAAGEEHLALDIRGERREWFFSCCPNHQPTRKANLEGYQAMAKTPGISGIIIDGARFSSPASSMTPESFFTCFCPNCREKMAALGFDPEKLEADVSGLYSWLRENGPRPQSWQGVQDWFRFRRLCAGEHLKDFAHIVHREGLLAGAFFFAPSLSPMVGQSYEDMAKVLDLISPMLYPAYPESPGDPGTACLNWELAAQFRLLTERGALSPEEANQLLSRQMGMPLPPLAELKKEVPRELIGKETQKAIKQGAPAQILPILQLDDPKLAESLKNARAAGVEEVAFFAYRRDMKGKLPPIPHRL